MAGTQRSCNGRVRVRCCAMASGVWCSGVWWCGVVRCSSVSLSGSHHCGMGVSTCNHCAIMFRHGPAENLLGLYFKRGRPEVGGVNVQQACEWFRRAASRGLATAQNNLAMTCFSSEDPETVLWYRRAAEGGHQGAQYNYAYCVAQGIGGVAQDVALAARWFAVAAAGEPGTVANNARLALDQLAAVQQRGDSGDSGIDEEEDWAAVARQFVRGVDATAEEALSEDVVAHWYAGCRGWANFTEAFAISGTLDDAGFGTLRDAAAHYEAVLALPGLSERRLSMLLSSMQQIFAALARSDLRGALRRGAEVNVLRAQLPACQAHFATVETDSSCWNTAVSAAVTYFRRAGDTDAADSVVMDLAKQHPFAATNFSTQLQTPHVFDPTLRAQAWWNAGDFHVVRALQQSYDLVKADLEALKALQANHDGERRVPDAPTTFHRVFSPGAPIMPANAEEDQRGSGAWSEFSLFDGYRWDEERCSVTPNICRILRSSPEVCGVLSDPTPCGTRVIATIFRLRPGSRVLPHTGVTNRRLVMQFAIEGSEGVTFRVGSEGKPYGGDGRAIVFDDSFEHEVIHQGPSTRYVLYAVLYHPDLELAGLERGDATATAWPSPAAAGAGVGVGAGAGGALGHPEATVTVASH